MTQVMTSTRPEATANRSTSGAQIVHDVTSLFVAHTEICTVCPRQTEPCRIGALIVGDFMRTSAGYFSQYTA